MRRSEVDQPSGYEASAGITGRPSGAGVTIMLTECVQLFEICIDGGVKAVRV